MALEEILDELRGIVHGIYPPVEQAVKTEIDDVVGEAAVHAGDVRGDVFRLCVEARRHGNARLFCEFGGRGPEEEGHEDMHHIRPLDRGSEDLLVSLGEGDVVRLQDQIQRPPIFHGHDDIPLLALLVGVGAHDGHVMPPFSQKPDEVIRSQRGAVVRLSQYITDDRDLHLLLLRHGFL